MRVQKTRLILKSIYLLKTKTLSECVKVILGKLENYKGSVWRLAMIHAVTSYVLSKNKFDRFIDIIETINIYVPEKKRDVRIKIFFHLLNIKNNELYEYIDTYNTFGKLILPEYS